MTQEFTGELHQDEKLVKTKLVILQPTNFCNIDCKYCYLPDRRSYNLMQPQTVDRVAQTLFESPHISEDLRVVWHAGEPLTVPVSFYRDAINKFSRFNVNNIHITWGIQTNGILINQDWCDFFKEYNVDVGVSVDGPEELHDRNRVDLQGRGTYQRVMKGVKFLRENGVGYGILMVVDGQAVKSPEAVWRFFVENRVTSVGFNPEEISGEHKQSSLFYGEAQNDMVVFLDVLYRLRRQQEGYNVEIREIDDMAAKIKSSELPINNALVAPFAILNIDYLGNISTFSPQLLGQSHPVYGDFRFGNVYRDKLSDISTSPKFKRIYSDIQKGVNKCRQTCAYFDVCGGGDPSSKLAEHNSFDTAETLECRLHLQASFEAVANLLEEEINT